LKPTPVFLPYCDFCSFRLSVFPFFFTPFLCFYFITKKDGRHFFVSTIILALQQGCFFNAKFKVHNA
ncbi:MAG: hypothetical protein J6A12_01965, partial [Oscillospiraceae bacterium]|nr:hypothetical protein [Oscillospiraceae bacterium]MBQ8594799.1 hypothetical protein [Oscillospiraceae bacterium]